jgi:molecular chaperone GrpE
MPDDAPAPAPAEGPAEPAPPPEAEPKEDWESRFKYLLADFENFRRRASKERETVSRQARGALLRELLPLIEAFRAAGRSLTRLEPTDPLRRGLELLDREWTTFLRHEGVEPVAEVGQPFRPEEEEAVGEAPAGPARPDGSVAEVVQQGYRYFGGVLRPAKVIVARAKPAGRAPSEELPTAGEPPEAPS